MHIVTAAGFRCNCLDILFANVDKLNIKQEKMNTLRWFFSCGIWDLDSSLWIRNKVIIHLVFFFLPSQMP